MATAKPASELHRPWLRDPPLLSQAVLPVEPPPRQLWLMPAMITSPHALSSMPCLPFI